MFSYPVHEFTVRDSVDTCNTLHNTSTTCPFVCDLKFSEKWRWKTCLMVWKYNEETIDIEDNRFCFCTECIESFFQLSSISTLRYHFQNKQAFIIAGSDRKRFNRDYNVMNVPSRSGEEIKLTFKHNLNCWIVSELKYFPVPIRAILWGRYWLLT